MSRFKVGDEVEFVSSKDDLFGGTRGKIIKIDSSGIPLCVEYEWPAMTRTWVSDSDVKALDFVKSAGETPKPKRADLLISAMQWATMVRDYLTDFEGATLTGPRLAVLGEALGNVDRRLKALKEMEK